MSFKSEQKLPHVNPFPRTSPLEAVLLRELVQVASACYERGWSHGTAGNFSLRGKNGIVWQSPSGLNKGQLDPKTFIPVQQGTGTPVSPGSAMPSGEMPVHLFIYNHVVNAKCVVHTHPPFLVSATRSPGRLRFQGEEMQKPLGCHSHLVPLDICVFKNPTPEEMQVIDSHLQDDFDDSVPMVILANHGVYAWGKSPMEALSYIEAVEFLCKTVR